jgi:hypothetical protein
LDNASLTDISVVWRFIKKENGPCLIVDPIQRKRGRGGGGCLITNRRVGGGGGGGAAWGVWLTDVNEVVRDRTGHP